jgi:hypothetical protein
METPVKMDDLGVPPISGNLHLHHPEVPFVWDSNHESIWFSSLWHCSTNMSNH